MGCDTFRVKDAGNNNAAEGIRGAWLLSRPGGRSALADLVARVGLVDDVDPALAAHELAVAVARLERLEGASDLHDLTSRVGPAGHGLIEDTGP